MRLCSSTLACRMMIPSHHLFDRAHGWSFEGSWKLDMANVVCRITRQHNKALSKRQKIRLRRLSRQE
jgi:hypothetical protein